MTTLRQGVLATGCNGSCSVALSGGVLRANVSDPQAPFIRAASIVLELTRVVVLVWRDADLPPSCLSFP